MKKTLSFLIALLLAVLAGCTPGLADKNAELAKAFEGGGTLQLVPAELFGVAETGAEPVGISPDGKTVLLRRGRDFGLARDGKLLPLAFNGERGAGDIFGKQKLVLSAVTNLPPMEGLSWSSDGRYAAISNLRQGLMNMQSMDAIVLDAASGEVYLADTFDRSILKGGGIVFLNRVDRSGTYLYYLLYHYVDGEPRLQFCRCPVEGGTREVLIDSAYDKTIPYDLSSGSALYEAADGSWLLTGTRGTFRQKENRDRMRLALIRFSPSGAEWKQEVISLGIPYELYQYSLSGWSAASGYGALCVSCNTNASNISLDGSYSLTQGVLMSVAQHVNFVRVLPGDSPSCDVWYLQKTGEGAGDAELRPAEDFLWAVRINSNRLDESETAEAEEWTAGSREKDGYYFPKDYGAEEYKEDLKHNSLLTILGACLSPDGHYALINAGSAGSFSLYLVDLETMKLLPVDAPEGVGGLAVSATAMGLSFAPGFIWNEDGTLLIGGDNGVRAFHLETAP